MKYTEKVSNINDLTHLLSEQSLTEQMPGGRGPNPGTRRGVGTGAPSFREKSTGWDPLIFNTGTGT